MFVNSSLLTAAFRIFILIILAEDRNEATRQKRRNGDRRTRHVGWLEHRV